MKIVILDGYAVNPGDISWAALEEYGEIVLYDNTPADQVVQRIGDAEIVFTNKTPLTKETFDACPSVRYVGVLATGYNVVDVASAVDKGIVVTNIPSYGTAAVAQLVFALLLEICHHAGAHSQAVFEGRWTRSKEFCFWDYPLIELAGKTFGIIGYGRIGRQTAKLAEALDMKILAYDQSPDKSLETENVKLVTLEEVLAQSDVISLHCPLLPDTKGMINKDSIAKMKDGVILLNTSRGPLIVEQDLVDALDSGKIFAAGLDVVSQEPIKADNPLLGARNCIITPHIAWAPTEARRRLVALAVENLAAFISGSPVNVVRE